MIEFGEYIWYRYWRENIISAKLDETKVVEIHKKTYLDENTNIISIELMRYMTEKLEG
jgi:hypothetical protein